MPRTETSPVNTCSSPLSVRTTRRPSSSTSTASPAPCPPSDVDTGGLVLLPERCKAIPRKGVQGLIKAEIRQSLGQPAGILLQIDRGTLQGQRGAVGQVSGIKITLRLGQVDANAAQDAPALLLVAVADAFAQDAHDLFAVQ